MAENVEELIFLCETSQSLSAEVYDLIWVKSMISYDLIDNI